MEKFNITPLDRLHSDLNQRETEILSPIATYSKDAMRRQSEAHLDTGYRQAFSVDADRILHSRAYTRYIDKTQVFYLIHNDHITHRVLHVQLVSKIARTVGRFLGLNEDLIEAIALGHDIGHTPFGHDGERLLSDLCHQHKIGFFYHNIQSVQFLDRVERKGKGWNLCLQTLDGILCHDGEIHNRFLKPQRDKTFKQLEKEIKNKREFPDTALTPMTMEGCVVRMADTVAYIGRDIEDAIRLGMVQRSELPRESVKILGETNGTIVYHLVTDIIQTSYKNDSIAFSAEVSEALKQLKSFNLKRIYMNPDIKQNLNIIRDLFEMLFNQYLEDIERENRDSVIYKGFLSDMSEEYVEQHSNEEVVRDFIAGMTDQYFLRLCPENMRLKSVIA
ncbi:MAG TPA: HD domain-containing protein [Deltaproteobacteria bacterium]|nr:HD domain-containing protein [Deltaproteobacteria bacterium]